MTNSIVVLPGSTPGSERVDLPSGGWAELRTRLGYGAVRKRKAIATRIGAKMAADALARGEDPEELARRAGDSLSAETLHEIGVASEHFPIVALVVAWSYELPLPEPGDYGSIDELESADGEFLLAECERRYAELTELRVTPDDHGDPESFFDSSSGSATSSKAASSARGSRSRRTGTSTG